MKTASLLAAALIVGSASFATACEWGKAKTAMSTPTHEEPMSVAEVDTEALLESVTVAMADTSVDCDPATQDCDTDAK